MKLSTVQFSKWFTPPIVVPVCITLMVLAYALYKNFA